MKYKTNKKGAKNLKANEKTLLLCAFIMLNLGFVSAYFDFIFYAISLLLIGLIIMNIFVFFVSYRKM